jgi:parvulin-like peptidyl-prolyl isomerase
MLKPGRAYRLIVFLSLAAVTPADAQPPARIPADTLAWIGPRVITSLDLLERMELMPFPESSKGVPPESLKAMTLRAMIAEKLLALERERLGLPEESGSLLMRQGLEDALVRDELYRRQVLDSTVPKRGEVAEGMKRFPKINRLLAFLTPSEADGETLARILKSAKAGDLLRDVPPALYTELDTLIVKFGAPDTAFESAAYAIGTSRVARPFHSAAFGWAVLYLLERTANPVASKMDVPDRSRMVEKIIRARHESDRYERYYKQVLAPHTAQADSALFSVLADSIESLWAEDTAHFLSHGSYMLTGDLVELIASRLHRRLDSVLVRLDSGNLTLGETLEMFRYADFRSKEREGLQFRKNLSAEVRDLAAQALLTREGRNEGLQYSPSVRKSLEVWTDFWAAREMYYRVRDSVTVSDGEILRHLVKYKAVFGRYYEVSLREVLCDSLSQVDAALDEIGRGEQFSAVAARRSRRAEWGASGGASGWFRVDRYPDIGFEAMNADTGKITGPVKLPEGWSIFQVIGKRRTEEGKAGFDLLKQNVRARLLGEKRKLALDRYIANLVRSRRVAIDAANLKKINVTHVPMFTRRLIGFGGRMAAYPMLIKAWDWVSQPVPPETVVP